MMMLPYNCRECSQTNQRGVNARQRDMICGKSKYTQYTPDLNRFSRQMERQVGALVGQGQVRGITKAWQRYVRSRATKSNQAYFDFYPRAVAYVIFYQLRRGRSSSRVAQILVKYERFNRFKRFRNR